MNKEIPILEYVAKRDKQWLITRDLPDGGAIVTVHDPPASFFSFHRNRLSLWNRKQVALGRFITHGTPITDLPLAVIGIGFWGVGLHHWVYLDRRRRHSEWRKRLWSHDECRAIELAPRRRGLRFLLKHEPSVDVLTDLTPRFVSEVQSVVSALLRQVQISIDQVQHDSR